MSAFGGKADIEAGSVKRRDWSPNAHKMRGFTGDSLIKHFVILSYRIVGARWHQREDGGPVRREGSSSYLRISTGVAAMGPPIFFSFLLPGNTTDFLAWKFQCR